MSWYCLWSFFESDLQLRMLAIENDSELWWWWWWSLTACVVWTLLRVLLTIPLVACNGSWVLIGWWCPLILWPLIAEGVVLILDMLKLMLVTGSDGGGDWCSLSSTTNGDALGDRDNSSSESELTFIAIVDGNKEIVYWLLIIKTCIMMFTFLNWKLIKKHASLRVTTVR